MCSFHFASFEGFLIFNDAVGCLAPLLSTVRDFCCHYQLHKLFSTLQQFSCVKATAVVEQCVHCNPIINVLNITIIITPYIENNIDNQGY